MLSPEITQPEAQAGWFNAVPLMSWLSARNVLAPDAEAVTLGVTDGAAAPEAGALGDPDPAEVADADEDAGALAADELADELHAVTSNAAPASAAAAVICLPFRAFVVNIDSQPLQKFP